MAKKKSIDEQVLFEMAFPRAVFINKLEELMGGALGEFYKAECAKANGLTRWVQHWMREVHQHLLYLSIQVYQHPIRGFTDRRKALDKAINEMLPQDNSYRNFAMNMVVKDYKLKKLKYPIPANATQRFYAINRPRVI